MTSPSATPDANAPARARITAIIGTLIVVAYTAVAMLQIMVWNPLAAAPGRTVDQIAADIAAADQEPGPYNVWWLLLIGSSLAVFLLGFTFVRPTKPREIARYYAVLIVLGGFGYFVASFASGMSLADTYGISGGDASPWGTPLLIASGIAVLLLVMDAASVIAAPRPVAVEPAAQSNTP